MSKGATKAGLGLDDIKAVEIPLPPLAEQEWIVAEVERQLSLVAQTEAAIDASEHRAKALRESLLRRAFSGELVPQDPQDENAQLLLERIRTERAAMEEEAKRTKRVPRRSNTMASKKGAEEKLARRPLLEVLNEAGSELAPDRLFDLAGFSTETVDEFFAELRKLTREKRIEDEKQGATVRILLHETSSSVASSGQL